MPGKARGYYRDTRTGAIRQSAAKLGFPFVEATKDEIDRLPGRQKAPDADKASSEGEKGKA